MSTRAVSRTLLAVWVLSSWITAPCRGGATAEEDPTFHGAIQALFAGRCVGCHGGERAKGGLRLDAYESLMAGGESGSPIVPGKPDESLLYRLVTGLENPSMPPRGKPGLEASDVALLRRWIERGALSGDPPATREPYSTPLEATSYKRLSPITAVAFSPDGTRVLTGLYREVAVTRVDRWERPGNATASATVSGDGSPAGSDAERAQRTRPLERRLVGEAERVLGLAFSPDGKRMAAVGGAPGRFGELQLWVWEEGRLERFYRAGRDTLLSVVFSPDGARVAAAGADRALHVYDVAGGEERTFPSIHADWVLAVRAFPSGAAWVTLGRDGVLKSLGPLDGATLESVVLERSRAWALAGVPGKDLVVLAGEDGKASLREGTALRPVRELAPAPGRVLALAASPDGTTVALGGAFDGLVLDRVEDGASSAARAVPTGWTFALAFSPDGERLAAGGHDGVLRLFSLKAEEDIERVLPVPLEPAKEVER